MKRKSHPKSLYKKEPSQNRFNFRIFDILNPLGSFYSLLIFSSILFAIIFIFLKRYFYIGFVIFLFILIIFLLQILRLFLRNLRNMRNISNKSHSFNDYYFEFDDF